MAINAGAGDVFVKLSAVRLDGLLALEQGKRIGLGMAQASRGRSAQKVHAEEALATADHESATFTG